MVTVMCLVVCCDVSVCWLGKRYSLTLHLRPFYLSTETIAICLRISLLLKYLDGRNGHLGDVYIFHL